MLPEIADVKGLAFLITDFQFFNMWRHWQTFSKSMCSVKGILVLESLFNKTAVLKAFLKTLTLGNICKWLLVHHKYFSMIFARSVAKFLEHFSTYLLCSLLCSHNKRSTSLCLRLLPIPVAVICSLTFNHLQSFVFTFSHL